MSSNAITAKGTKVKIGIGSPVVYTDIPEIVSFSGPGGNAQIIDVSNLDSVAVEKLMGLPDEGQLTININYVPDNVVHQAVRAARGTQEVTPFRMIFPDGGATQWDFNAFVTGFQDDGGVNAALKAAVTLEITGPITES